MKKAIFCIIGAAIAGILLYPRIKKEISGTKKCQEECKQVLNEVAKEMEDEKLRHEREMKRIKEETEIVEKNYEEAKEAIKRCEKIIQGCDGIEEIHCMMKYRDSNGEIHEFDAADPAQFHAVFSNRKDRITLIF